MWATRIQRARRFDPHPGVAPARARAQALPPVARADDPFAARPEQARRARAHRGRDDRRVRQGAVLPGAERAALQARGRQGRRRAKGQGRGQDARPAVPPPRGPLARAREEPRLRGAGRRVARLARDRRAAQGRVRAVRRARERGRAVDRLRRRGRPLARRIRRDPGRLRGRHRAPVGRGEAALRRAPLLRARAPAGEVRQGQGARPRANPLAAPRQHVGAGVEQRRRPRDALSGGALARRRQGPGSPEMGVGEDGEAGRALLHGPGLRSAPSHVLGALALHAPARPRRRVPRERVGRHVERRPPREGVPRADRGGLRHDPPRARARLLLPALREAADPLRAGRQRRLPRGHRRHHRPQRHARVRALARPAPRCRRALGPRARRTSR